MDSAEQMAVFIRFVRDSIKNLPLEPRLKMQLSEQLDRFREAGCTKAILRCSLPFQDQGSDILAALTREVTLDQDSVEVAIREIWAALWSANLLKDTATPFPYEYAQLQNPKATAGLQDIRTGGPYHLGPLFFFQRYPDVWLSSKHIPAILIQPLATPSQARGTLLRGRPHHW